MKNPFLLLFPPRCAVCGKIVEKDGFLCPDCAAGLPEITEPRCAVCGAPLASPYAMSICADCRKGVPYEKCFVPFLYKGGIRRAIVRMKFGDRPSGCRFFARRIAEEIGEFRPDFITFVPQNRATRRKRGYNQTELIARELGKMLGVPVRKTLLRSEAGEKQVTLSRAKRLENAKRLYSPAAAEKLEGVCLIVDDVITTGATMKACCAQLRKMGCGRVFAAAAARTELIK